MATRRLTTPDSSTGSLILTLHMGSFPKVSSALIPSLTEEFVCNNCF